MVRRKEMITNPDDLRSFHDLHLLAAPHTLPNSDAIVDWSRRLSMALTTLRNAVSEVKWVVPPDRGTSHTRDVYLFLSVEENPELRASQYLYMTDVGYISWSADNDDVPIGSQWPMVSLILKEIPASSEGIGDWIGEEKTNRAHIEDVERWMRRAEDRALGRA